MNRTGFLFGVAFGFLIVASGLSDSDFIRRMLLLQEPDGFLMLGAAVGVAMPLLWLLERRRWQTPLGGPLIITRGRVERHHILGAMVFGVGWAVAGTCPGPALATAVGGGVLALFVMGGLWAGLLLRDAVADRQSAGHSTSTSATEAPAQSSH